MKNFLFLALLSSALGFTACEKEAVTPDPVPTNPTTNNPGENKWTVEGITYTNTGSSAVWNGGGTTWGLMGNGSNDSLEAFQLWFKTNTPRTGTYNIIPFLSLFSTTDSNAVAISISIVNRGWQSATNNGTVAVVNTNGVVSATVTNIPVKRTTDTTNTIVSGNLTYRP